MFILSTREQDIYIGTRLRIVCCVLREDGRLVSADQVYDPTDSLLVKLLSGEELFPHVDYTQPAVIESLAILG